MAKKGNEVPAAPDYSNLIKASQAQVDKANNLQQQQFDWAKENYAGDKARADAVAKADIDNMTQSTAAAKQAQDRYTNTAIPLQDKFIDDANGYDTDARRDLNMGAAQGKVAASFDAARENAQRDLEAFGLNPSSTRYAALDIGTRTQQAAAEAAAGTTAANQTEQTGRDMRLAAINMTSGLPQQANAALASSTNSGAGAVNADATATGTGANTMGTAPQYGSLANGAIGTTANVTGANFNDQLAKYNAQFQEDTAWMAPIGAVAGVATGALLKKAAGGGIPVQASPSRGAIPDDVHAMVTPGEFVMPVDTVRWLGEKSMHAMITKAAEERANSQRPNGSAIPQRMAA